MTDVGWSWRRRTPDPRPSAEKRLAEAEAALRGTEQIKDQATKQVSLFQELRRGWDRVHQKNNLAGLFTEEYRRTHGN